MASPSTRPCTRTDGLLMGLARRTAAVVVPLALVVGGVWYGVSRHRSSSKDDSVGLCTTKVNGLSVVLTASRPERQPDLGDRRASRDAGARRHHRAGRRAARSRSSTTCAAATATRSGSSSSGRRRAGARRGRSSTRCTPPTRSTTHWPGCPATGDAGDRGRAARAALRLPLGVRRLRARRARPRIGADRLLPRRLRLPPRAARRYDGPAPAGTPLRYVARSPPRSARSR